MKKIAILGFGISGRAAFDLLKITDSEIYVFDDKKNENKSGNLFFGDKGKEKFYKMEFDEIVTSPGISKFHPFIQYALKNSIPIISEIELGYRFAKCPIVAVTGTNGKTTTVTLIEKTMKAANKRAVACGNYGFPLTKAVLGSENLDYLIVEASSYQLEFIKEFKPFIGVILNIGSDHLKWHQTKEGYKKAKLNIFKNQDKNGYFIKNEEDTYQYKGGAQLVTFSRKNSHADCFLNERENKVIVNYKRRTIIDRTNLFGCGNLENIAVSALVADICNINSKITVEVIEKMENLPNRIEFVGQIDNVKFYNDSKSTNIDSVVNALNSFKEDEKIVLILGGKHKGEPFSSILDILKEKTRAVIVYGEDKHIIMKELEKLLPVPLPALNIKGALVGAFEVAANNDIVLFSPGGSSCEPYKNYEERGEAFKKEFSAFKEYYENTPKV